MISTAAASIIARSNPSPPRRRRSSSTSLSPAKENSGVQNSSNSKVGTKRKRTKSSSSKCEKLTFWGWSPKKAKFKPKIMDDRGELTDHPEAVAIRSKWQPIVN